MAFLFISNDASFNQRIKSESGSKAMIAGSLHQGAEWVSSPKSCYKAIFFNPNDSSYSAISFLELCLQVRPGTPVYLLEHESEIDPMSLSKLLSRHHIHGVFRKNASYDDLLSLSGAFRDFIVPAQIQRSVSPKKHPGFVSVPVVDFANAGRFVFDVFLENESGNLSLFGTAGTNVPAEILTVLNQNKYLYVSERVIEEIRNELYLAKTDMQSRSHIPVSWKAAETLYKAKVLLQNLQTTCPSDQIVNSSYEILSDVFHLITHLQATKDQQKLNQFIEQAISSDRNVACATLAILMCKSLKFEKNAIEEILGVASMFQDVSLYHSPFGDLSRISLNQMNPEQSEFYLNHPNASADLLAENTSIPAVTLQVIRQHHERKDRSGFPRKIGGIQLHPMAEILSLINEVIERNPKSLEAENEIFQHYSDNIVHAYQEIEIRKNQERKAAA